jgi:GNAT superfamily N-acetyltransferase
MQADGGNTTESLEMDIAFAEADDATVQALRRMVNVVYADCEGDLWEAGAAFERTNDEEIRGLLSRKELLVARTALADGQSGGAGPIAGCIHVHHAAPDSAADSADDPSTANEGELNDTHSSPTRVGEFGMLCVPAAARRRGVGAQLVLAAEAWAAAAGCGALRCELLMPRHHVHPHKQRCLVWYAKLGYGESGLYPFENKYPLLVERFGLKCPCDAHLLLKQLG